MSSATAKIEAVILLHGGGLSSEVADQISSKLPSSISLHKISMSKSKDFQAALIGEGPLAEPTTLAIFIAQTIENEDPPEDAGACVRFFQRKTHPDTLLRGKVRFAVLGLGDSNLLLDRQHTSAKDCNRVAQKLDSRLEALGGVRFCDRGECDERTGMSEVEPWIEMLVEKVGMAAL
jgi:sulfite reductase alpha subunit-like flavoprotein